jgi:predicted phosphohydrolase
MEFFSKLFQGTPKQPASTGGSVSFLCLSDTHNKHDQLKLPEADVLLHAGDWSMMGYQEEVQAFNSWLGKVPYKHKLVIAGNHELTFEHVREAELRTKFQIM